MEETSHLPAVDDKTRLLLLKRLVATESYNSYVSHKCRVILALWEAYDRFIMSAPTERFCNSFNEVSQKYASYSQDEILSEIRRLEKSTFTSRDLITSFEVGRGLYESFTPPVGECP